MRAGSSVSARRAFCWSVWPHFILNAAKCAHLLLPARFSPLMALMWAFVGFDVGLRKPVKDIEIAEKPMRSWTLRGLQR